MPSVVNTSASVNEAFGDKNCLLEALDNKAKNLTGALFLGGGRAEGGGGGGGGGG